MLENLLCIIFLTKEENSSNAVAQLLSEMTKHTFSNRSRHALLTLLDKKLKEQKGALLKGIEVFIGKELLMRILNTHKKIRTDRNKLILVQHLSNLAIMKTLLLWLKSKGYLRVISTKLQLFRILETGCGRGVLELF